MTRTDAIAFLAKQVANGGTRFQAKLERLMAMTDEQYEAERAARPAPSASVQAAARRMATTR